MSEILTMILHGGPHDGEAIQIHRDNLKIKPRVSMRNAEGKVTEYGFDNEGKFVWLPDPSSPKVRRGVFVFDDDGNVISEETSVQDAMEKLDDLNDDSERWKFE